jgi:hypothetical protein
MRRHRTTSTAKHRLPAPDEVNRVVHQRTIEMVDHTGTAHFLTVDAAADGRPRGRYTAVCSERILPGALVAKVAAGARCAYPSPPSGVCGDRREVPPVRNHRQGPRRP